MASYSVLPAAILRMVITTLFLSAFFCLTAHAQRTAGMNADGDVLGGSNSSSGGVIRQDGWLLVLNGGYESPLGDVKESYQGSPTFGISVMRRMGNFLYSATVDHRAYKPLADLISITYDDENYFEASFSKYKAIGLYLGVAYEVPLSGDINFYGGVNGGYMLVSYKILVNDPNFSSIEEASNAQNTYIAPKLGLNFMLSSRIGMALEGRYSLGVIGANYNSRSGGSTTKGFNSVAGNIFLTYNF